MDLFDLVYHTSSIFAFTLGIYVLVSDFRKRNNRVFFYLTLTISGWIESVWWAFYYVNSASWQMASIIFRSSFFFSALAVSFLTLFFYFFPRVTVPIKKKYKVGFIALVFIFSSLSLTNLVYEGISPEFPHDILGTAYPLYVVFILGNFFASLYLATKKYKLSKGIEREKMMYVNSGCFVTVFLAMLINLILPAFGIVLLVAQELAPLFALFFIVPAFYALIRYRFFNFTNASLNSIRNIIIFLFYSATVTLSYFALNFFIEHGILRGIMSSIIGLFIYEIVKGKIPILVTASFKHFKDNLAEFKIKIYHCDTYKKMDKLVENVFLLNLNFVTARIFAVRNSADDIGLSTYSEGEFSHIIVDHFKDAITIDEIDFRKKLNKSDKKLVKKEMHKLHADLCLPLFSESNLIGFFILKQKNSSDPYSKEELNEILKIKKDLEVGLMNILLKMNLQEENNLMKSIIDKKTSQLKKNIEEVREVLEQQSDFIAVTAHEFRTPITIASFQLEDILNSKKKPKEASKELKIVQDSIDNLKNLTEKLFAVQQYDLNKVTLNTQIRCLNNFIKALHQEFLPLMKEKRLAFELKIKTKKKIFVKIDELQMRQVMHNLLKNASKFTPENGKVAMIMEVSEKNVLIKVDDNGAGINNQLKETIFDKFRTQAAGAGIGLGLYLCKKIIHLHKGKIWVEDSSMGGASFCIELKSTIK